MKQTNDNNSNGINTTTSTAVPTASGKADAGDVTGVLSGRRGRGRRVLRTRASGPGARSFELLEWVGRLGAAGVEPVTLALELSPSTAKHHIARLVKHGLVVRIAPRDGKGGAIAITPAGLRAVRERGPMPVMAPRAQAASTATHARAVSWVAASMQRRGFEWSGPPQMREQGSWRVTRDDQAGHAPDLGVIINGRRMAVEVELQPKAKTRLVGILNGYRRAVEARQLDGVTYVCGRPDIVRLVQGQATRAMLSDGLELGTLDQVIQRVRGLSDATPAQR